MTSIGECQPVPDSAAPDSPAAPQRKGRLLIVDDEEGPRQSLRVIFKDDYEVVMANDGPSAIAAAQEQRVDVAVLDIRMTGMSGIEVLERLKYVDPGIEVVMMPAFETTDTMRQALRLRAFDYINKPFDVATVRAAVARAMQKRTLEGELHNVEKSHSACSVPPPGCAFHPRRQQMRASESNRHRLLVRPWVSR